MRVGYLSDLVIGWFLDVTTRVHGVREAKSVAAIRACHPVDDERIQRCKTFFSLIVDHGMYALRHFKPVDDDCIYKLMQNAEGMTMLSETAPDIYKRMHVDPPPYMEHVRRRGMCYDVVPFEWLVCRI